MLDSVFHILKVSVVVAVCAIFMLAINTIINLIVTLVFHNVVGEVFALGSMFMPFNAGIVFANLGLAISAILAFLVAKKIFDLTSWSISSI